MRHIASYVVAIAVMGCASSPQHPVSERCPAAIREALSDTEFEWGDTHGKRLLVAPMQNTEDGVYFFHNGYSTLILELRDVRYRYWFSSDLVGGEEPEYPLSGRYISNGSSIRLEHQQRHMQDQWTFRKLNGETTLWRPAALRSWREKRAFDYYGVLYPTKLKPEDIWLKDVWKVGP